MTKIPSESKKAIDNQIYALISDFNMTVYYIPAVEGEHLELKYLGIKLGALVEDLRENNISGGISEDLVPTLISLMGSADSLCSHFQYAFINTYGDTDYNGECDCNDMFMREYEILMGIILELSHLLTEEERKGLDDNYEFEKVIHHARSLRAENMPNLRRVKLQKLLESSTIHVTPEDLEILKTDNALCISNYLEGAFVNIIPTEGIMEDVIKEGYSIFFQNLYQACLNSGVTTLRLDADCGELKGFPEAKGWI